MEILLCQKMEKIKARFIKKPENGFFAGYILQRIKRNKNFLAAITGPTGSGKTYASLALAESLDPNFKVGNIVFTPEEFVLLLNDGGLKKGANIVFDEAGVALNNRKWHSAANNLIQFILQTFRHKNFVVWFTAPDFGFIDAAARKLFHCQIETQGINFSTSKCRLKPFMIQVNQRTGNMYYKYLVMSTPETGEMKINQLLVGKPSEELIKQYEIKKTDFTNKLNKEVQDKLTLTDQNQEKELPQLTEKQRTILELLEDGFVPKEMVNKLMISQRTIYDHMRLIRKKGYNIIRGKKFKPQKQGIEEIETERDTIYNGFTK